MFALSSQRTKKGNLERKTTFLHSLFYSSDSSGKKKNHSTTLPVPERPSESLDFYSPEAIPRHPNISTRMESERVKYGAGLSSPPACNELPNPQSIHGD